MPVTINLTPATISAGDYSTAQQPILGGQMQVYLTASPSRLLGTALVTDDAGTIDYKFVNTPSANPPGPILVVAEGGGVQQSAATTITFAGLTGSFTPVGYASNQGFNFPVSRGVELTGSYVAPTSSSVPTVSSTMLRGSKFALIEFPPLSSFKLAGCTNQSSIKIPGRMTKSIPCGMKAAEWTVPGRTQVGSLEVTGLNVGADGGLNRYIGVKCQAMIVTLKEDRLITERDFVADWTPSASVSNPDGDSESTLSVSSDYATIVLLPAP